MPTTECAWNSRQVKAVVNYSRPSDEALCIYYLVDPPAGRERSNAVVEPREVLIHSLREANRSFTLDVEGFELIKFSPRHHDIYDTAQREAYFDPAVAEVVKRLTGASEVRVFDPFLRGEEAQRRIPGSISEAADRIHVDYTHDDGAMWFDQVLGPDADRLRGRRFAIINFWRPITGPLQDHPLAMGDCTTIPFEDYVVVETHARRDEHGLPTPAGEAYQTETYRLLYRPEHRWYYVPDMMPDEALLLKNYDSQLDGVARFSPHTAFEDPTTPANRLPRASIEVRTLVIW